MVNTNSTAVMMYCDACSFAAETFSLRSMWGVSIRRAFYMDFTPSTMPQEADACSSSGTVCSYATKQWGPLPSSLEANVKASMMYRISAVFLLLLATGHLRGDIGLAAGEPSASKPDAAARHLVGVRSLFRRHHDCELEISLCSAHRFLRGDHTLSNGSSMALSPAGFHAT